MARAGDWLLQFKNDVASQHGDDGIIAKIFDVVGETNRWCVELGALNGTHDSNCWNLLKKKGWSGVLIEADQTYFEKLQAEYAGNQKAHCVREFISFEGEQSLDAVFARTPLPKEFDLFSLDIDGNEYHLWESLREYRPRVMVVEFNPTIPHEVAFVQPRDMRVFQGSSLAAFVELGKRKGYELIAANETNAFFVLRELFPTFDIADNSLDAVHPDRRFETKLFQLYDGTLMIAGNDTLLWHKIKIDPERLQVLPRRKRVYPAMISDSPAIRSLKYYARKLPFYPFVQRLRKRFLS